MFKKFVLAALLVLASTVALAQDLIGTITILEGDALVYRGLGRVQAAEGVRLGAGDIIEMGGTGFMQIELPDNTVLQIGPRSRALLNASSARPKPERSIYVIEGWIKISADKRDAKGGPGLDLRSPLLEIPAQEGALVIKIAATDVAAFAESAEAKIVERQASGVALPVSLKLGDLYVRKAGTKGIVDPAGRSAFLTGMPAVFKDSLPSRIDRYRDKPVTPKAGSEFSYAEIEPWLKSDPAMRKQFVQRWRAKATDPAFRTALIANLNGHPEWDPILYPEKYLPKPPPPPPPQVARPQAESPRVETPAAPPSTTSLPAPIQSLPPPTQ